MLIPLIHLVPRNILDEDAECRYRLRQIPGLVAALTHVCFQCVRDFHFDGKSLENCVCILRNLSFALQETRDPAYLVRREVEYSTAATTPTPEKKIGFKHLFFSPKARSRGIVMSTFFNFILSRIVSKSIPD